MNLLLKCIVCSFDFNLKTNFSFLTLHPVFAVQNGGACFSGPEAEQTYKRYGKSESCKSGKGGPFANNVYKTFDDGEQLFPTKNTNYLKIKLKCIRKNQRQ